MMHFSSQRYLALTSILFCSLVIGENINAENVVAENIADDDEFDLLLTEDISAGVTPGIDIALTYQDQEQEINDATLTSATFSPYLRISDWTINLDIPWQSVKGAYSYNIPLRLSEACERIYAGRPLRLRREQAIERVTRACDALANNSFENDGMGDVTTSLHYGHWLSAKVWRLGFGLSYKFDNADFETFLGSGTQDILFDISLLGNFEHFSTTFYAGNTFIVGGELEDFYDDYSHIGGTLATPWKYMWQLGAGWEYQNPNDSSLQKWKIFGGVELGKHSRVDLQYVYFDSADYAVESEASASLLFYF